MLGESIPVGSYAVTFTSRLHEEHVGYAEMVERMDALVAQQPGFLGVHSVRDGLVGITISYWKDEASIAAWRAQAEHLLAQAQGRAQWYVGYTVIVSKVERSYAWPPP